MTQPELFSCTHSELSKSLKKHGQDSVLTNEREEWKTDMEAVIHDVCLRNRTFTMDTVRELAEECKIKPPHHPNAFGAVVKVAARNQWALMTGEYIPSKNIRARGRMVAVWKSYIYEK